jgi:ectoine hydroxylase-related dioxygenase (phytanoyl-CoA dioxygenase family)
MNAMLISREHKETFQDRGLIKLEQRLPVSVIEPARQLVYENLIAAGMCNEDGWIGPKQGNQGYSTVKGLKQCSRSRVFRAIITDEIKACLSELAGRQTNIMPPHSQLLFTAPWPSVMGVYTGRWDVPYATWHTDLPPGLSTGLRGIQLFSFLDEVKPRSGGTLVVSGSQRLLSEFRHLPGKQLKRKLRQKSFFSDLINRDNLMRKQLMHEAAEVDGVLVKVHELTGKPGEVFAADMRLFHSLGDNCSEHPRLMVSQRFSVENS